MLGNQINKNRYIGIAAGTALSMALASLSAGAVAGNAAAAPQTKKTQTSTQTVSPAGLKALWQVANPKKQLAQSGKEAAANNDIPAKATITAPTEKTATPAKKNPDAVFEIKEQSKSASADGSTASKKNSKNAHPDVLPMLTWYPAEAEPKAVLLCVHGLGLNNDSYKEFADKFCNRGYLIYSVDVPGFGSFQNANEGRDRVDFDYCLRGIRDTLKLIHKINPGKPVFVLGESMGGAIALRVTSLNPDLVSGLISSVPSGDRFKQGKETLRVGLKLLTAPNKTFDIGTSVIARATDNADLKEKWSGDPLNRMDLTPKELLRFQSFMNENHDSAKQITQTPVLFVQGCKDKLVRPEGTQELFNSLATKDRQIELIHDKEHLIFEEGQFDDHVLDIVDKWLVEHIDNKKQLTSNK